MKHLTANQTEALSLVWNKPTPPDPSAVDSYFAFTDRGVKPNCSHPDFQELLFNHKFLPVTVEMWKEDFACGLLYLQEFDDERPALRELAYRAYYSTLGFIPRICKYREEFLAKHKLSEYSPKFGLITVEFRRCYEA